MTDRPFREKIRVATIHARKNDPEWPRLCQRAYRLVQEHGGTDDVSPIEPYGQGPDGFEWHVYAHQGTRATGLRTSYVVIVETDRELLEDEIDLDAVVDYLTEWGVDAYVEQTGGGCATIFAGPTRDTDEGPMFAAAAGPGVYSWDRSRHSVANLREFYVGCDDGGETGDYVSPGDVGAGTAEDVAKLIKAQVDKMGNSQVPIGLTFDDVRHLGFDGTGRGLRQD